MILHGYTAQKRSIPFDPYPAGSKHVYPLGFNPGVGVSLILRFLRPSFPFHYCYSVANPEHNDSADGIADRPLPIHCVFLTRHLRYCYRSASNNAKRNADQNYDDPTSHPLIVPFPPCKAGARTYTPSMLKRSSKPQKDTQQRVRSVLDQNAPNADKPPEKNPAAVALGRLGGLKGGDARAKSLSAKRRKEIATKAAAARWKPAKD